MTDSHLHIWELERFKYSWITSDLPALFCDYTIEKALMVLKANNVNNAVLVEADSSLGENWWLLEVANAHPEILAVVGWCDLTSPTLEQELEPLMVHPKFRGVRPRIPSAQAEITDWEALHNGLNILERHHLSCDLLIDRLSPHSHGLVSAHPRVEFILDHFAGAQLAFENHASWAASLECFADLSNVNLKVSGFLTAAKTKPLEPDVFALFFQTALELFGVTRLMFGSDHPVCMLGGQYQDTIRMLTQNCEPDDANCIWDINARRVYGLGG
jgi:L-fuconolactonase